MRFFNRFPPPVAIGGVGGSGTRLIATILSQLGYFMGSDLNKAMDNLTFTLLFKRTELWPPELHSKEVNKACNIFIKASLAKSTWRKHEISYLQSLCHYDRPTHSIEWLEARAEQLLQSAERDHPHGNWGWKEPNTHIILPALLKKMPKMKYIHVSRHGLDMAYSKNQNQLKLWGEQLLDRQTIDVNPSTSFQYWCTAHRRITQVGKTMKGRFLMLNFDKLCQQPEIELALLFRFLEIEPSPEMQSHLATLVQKPKSQGRHGGHNISYAKPADLLFLEEMGYTVLK